MTNKNIIRRLLTAVLTALLLPMVAAATAPTLSIEDFTINAGETQTMLIDLSNPDTEVTLVQFDLRLPAGLTIAEELGDLAIDIAGRTTWQKHSLQANATGGITRFLLASNSNKVITGTSGAIISIQLTAANTFKGGDIKLEEQLIVTPSAAETYPADITYKVSAPSPATGTPPTLSIEDYSIKAGETQTMLIDLSNPDTEVTLVQFDLRLPAGLTIVEEQGDLVIDIAGRTTWQKHSLQANATGGITRFLLASGSNKVISGTSGAIISIQLTAANTFKGGDIKLEDQLIVTPSAAETYPADYTYKVPAPSSATGTPPTLSIEDFTIKAGETQTMLIDLSNPDTEVTLVQFDLRLPSGLTIAVDEGDLAIDIAGRTTWQKHSLQANATGGITRFLLASNSNKVISGTSGAIISIQLTAANTFKGGDIKLEDQLIVTPSAAETYPADYTYKVSAASPATGTPPTLSIEDFTINAGETQTMLIDLSNPDTEVTLVQFDLRLPAGLTIAEEQGDLVIDIAGRTTWQSHSLQANATGGITRFLLASNGNKVITGTSGAIISIQLTAANTFKGGDIKLEEQLIVTPSAAETYPADYTYNVSAGSTVRGDANGDGTISVTDIAVVVNCILQLPNTGSFSEYGADANGDGDITVTDIGVIVDKILGTKTSANSRKMEQEVEPQ